MPEGVKLSDKSETRHKHVEKCMCYHSTIASGQLANAFLGGGLVGFFSPLMGAENEVVRLGTGHPRTHHMLATLARKGQECVIDQPQAGRPTEGWCESTWC